MVIKGSTDQNKKTGGERTGAEGERMERRKKRRTTKERMCVCEREERTSGNPFCWRYVIMACPCSLEFLRTW